VPFVAAMYFFFFQAEDGIRAKLVPGVQTCALPILLPISPWKPGTLLGTYERRVLTYVPSNVPGFQVEMGNIGLHYFDWRYKDAGKPTGTVTSGSPAATSTPGSPVPTSTGTTPTTTRTPSATPNVITQGQIAFASKRTGNYEIW